jgi:hypothetical protein
MSLDLFDIFKPFLLNTEMNTGDLEWYAIFTFHIYNLLITKDSKYIMYVFGFIFGRLSLGAQCRSNYTIYQNQNFKGCYL